MNKERDINDDIDDYFERFDKLDSSIKEESDKKWQAWLKREEIIFDRMSKIKKIIGFCRI